MPKPPSAAPRRDLAVKLREQLEFIERSCSAYDEGHRSEAIRIAVAIRVLLHDSRTSTSLMKHLGNPAYVGR